MSRPISALVTIQSVRAEPTRGTSLTPGPPRFVIVASRITDDPEGGQAFKFFGVTTLDPWKASICDRARQTRQTLEIVVRDTGYFDKDLVSVEFVKDEQVSA